MYRVAEQVTAQQSLGGIPVIAQRSLGGIRDDRRISTLERFEPLGTVTVSAVIAKHC